jgi:hypothetical protein
MISDIVMIALVLAGIALTLSYFYVAVLLWRRHARSERRKQAALRMLHAERLRPNDAVSPGQDPSIPANDRQIAA